MAPNDYHFITYWRVKATVREVVDILSDATSLPRWWPSVYLEVHELEAGDANGIGKQVALFTKGWLPYTLRWQFCVSEVKPTGFTIAADGDFVGRGIWTFVQDGEYVKIIYDWRIRVEKPLLKHLSLLFKPIFAQNHRWAMAQGEASLKLELLRRRPSAAVMQIAPPPEGTPSNPLRWTAYVLSHL